MPSAISLGDRWQSKFITEEIAMGKIVIVWLAFLFVATNLMPYPANAGPVMVSWGEVEPDGHAALEGSLWTMRSPADVNFRNPDRLFTFGDIISLTLSFTDISGGCCGPNVILWYVGGDFSQLRIGAAPPGFNQTTEELNALSDINLLYSGWYGNGPAGGNEGPIANYIDTLTVEGSKIVDYITIRMSNQSPGPLFEFTGEPEVLIDVPPIPSGVPEPSTLFIFAAGLFILGPFQLRLCRVKQ